MTSNGCNRGDIRILSYIAIAPSLRYWLVVKFSECVSILLSFIQVTLVGGDPEEEQLTLNTSAEFSCSDKMLTWAREKSISYNMPQRLKNSHTCKYWYVDANMERHNCSSFIRNMAGVNTLVMNAQNLASVQWDIQISWVIFSSGYYIK